LNGQIQKRAEVYFKNNTRKFEEILFAAKSV